MLLVRLALSKGANFSAVSLNSLRGSVLCRCSPSMTLVKSRFKATQKSDDDEIDLDAPIKFSSSRAATWKSRITYSGEQTEVNKRPWFEPYVVIVSISVFLIYFCILREESEVDKEFSKTLYDHISGLEEKQLELALEHSIATGKETTAIKNRLAELQRQKEPSFSPNNSVKS